MGLRAAIYLLILTVGLFGATGLGPFLSGQPGDQLSQGILVAAPLAQDNGDNGSDNGGSDNGDDNGGSDNGSDNGGSDNGSDNGGSSDNGSDNGVVASSATSTPTPGRARTPTPRPGGNGQPGPTGGPCWFVFGFKALHDLIPGIVGECQSNEIHSANGDGLQYTSGGLMVWRKADNWTAFTNGSITWLNGPCGLQTRPNEGPFYPWEGKVGSPCITLEPGEPEQEPLAFWP